MIYSQNKMEEFVDLLERHTPNKNINPTSIPELFTYRETVPHGVCAKVYEPGVAIVGQGKKYCYLDHQKYDCSAGNYQSLILPMSVEVKVVEASQEKPLLGVWIKFDVSRIANILQKMDQVNHPSGQIDSMNISAIQAEPIDDLLLEPVIKLLRTIDNPLEQEVLGDAYMDEFYFRLLCNDRRGDLRKFVLQQGQMKQISKAVNHINSNLDEVISVDQLARMVNMSTSGFRKTFREIMHMPPLQYAKAIKLDRAQRLLREGKNANEAGAMVGYNSPAQFSREYKRHFGFSPSATLSALYG